MEKENKKFFFDKKDNAIEKLAILEKAQMNKIFGGNMAPYKNYNFEQVITYSESTYVRG